MESFVLERLKSEVRLSNNQYGGIKGCSTEHFLLDTWDKILTSMDISDDSAANLVSRDFQKAFNRMGHRQCLFALADLGASEQSMDWVAAFLFGRTKSHLTTRRREIKALAAKSEQQFLRVKGLADTIGMRVNEQKTQILCIHGNPNSNIRSYIRTEEEEIVSADTLKILGFSFSNKPDATHHVTELVHKFYNKLWTLRFLKRNGMDRAGLLKIYFSVLRPAVEYCSTVYHSSIPQYMSDRLERLQKQAIRIIYGPGVDYNRLVSSGVLETLEERRTKACIRFANRAVLNPRFGDRWFPRNPAQREARNTTRRVYDERKCRTERARRNPLLYMTRLLNEQET